MYSFHQIAFRSIYRVLLIGSRTLNALETQRQWDRPSSLQLFFLIALPSWMFPVRSCTSLELLFWLISDAPVRRAQNWTSKRHSNFSCTSSISSSPRIHYYSISIRVAIILMQAVDVYYSAAHDYSKVTDFVLYSYIYRQKIVLSFDG